MVMPAPEAMPEAEGSERKILIVDDDPDFAEGLELLLTAEGYAVQSAHDIADATHALNRFDADLILVDLHLGKESGVDLIDRLKVRRPSIGCVLMTAYVEIEAVVSALRHGAEDFLTKPIHKDLLLTVLDRCFERRELEKAKAAAEEALREAHDKLERRVEERTSQLSQEIRQRIEAEEAVKESEIRFRDLIEGSIEGIVINRDFKPLFANDTYVRLLGYDSTEEIIGLDTVLETAAPHERARIEGYAAARLRGDDAPSQYEYEGLRKDGSTIWLDNRIRLVSWKGKAAIQSTVVDITERRRAERELQESKQRLDDYLGATSDWFWEMDENCRFSYFSDRFEEVTGVPPRMLLGKTREETGIPDVDPAAWQEHLDNLAARRSFRDFRHPRTLADGGVVTLSINGKAIFDAEGKFQGYRGTGRDITGLVTAERQARRAETLLTSAVEGLSELFALWDGDDRLVLCNEEFRQINRRVIETCQPGVSFHDHIRAALDAGLYPEAEGREKEWYRERIARHRDPAAPFESARQDGRWLLINEQTMPGGGTVTISTDITERKRTERELKQSREILRALADNLPEFISLKDPEGRFLFVNKRFEEWVCMDQNEIVGKTVHDIYPAEQAAEFDALDREAIASRSVRSNEVDLHYPDGNTRAVVRTRFPVISSDGEVLGLGTINIDVSEYKRIEQALRESERRYRHIFDDSIVGTALVAPKETEPDGRFSQVNRAFCEMLGYSEEELLCMTINDVTHPDDHEPNVRLRSKIIEGLTDSFQLEKRYIHKSGRTVWAQLSVTAIRDEDGRYIYDIGHHLDITDLKATEAALREREAILNAVVENVPISLCLKDREGRFTLVNPGFERLHGVTAAEVLGKTFFDILPDEIAADAASEDRHVLESGEPLRTDYSWPAHLGVQHELIFKFPLRLHPEGPITGVGVIALDITEQRRQEEQLRQAQKMEAVGQLTGGIAHDFNNLMAIILGNISYLDRKLEPDSQLRELTAPALRAVERGASLTQRLLAFSREQSLVTETVDVGKLLAELGELLRRSLGEDLGIEIATSPDLWRCQVDPGQLEQAVVNLANNARDAMPNGGNLSIEVSNETLSQDDHVQGLEITPGEYVMISLADDGNGMAPEVRDKIFDPFFTTKEVGQGSGLGLSMVYGFVQQSGGHIRVDSQVGVGTTVRLYLPAVTQVDAPAPRAAEAALGSEPGARVLLVEDDEDLRAMTRIFLIDLGYQVLDASTGQEALKIFDENGGIDLLLSDVVLPGGLNGPDVAAEARRSKPDLKVVYMSGYVGDALERRGGIDADAVLIQKPFDDAILGRRLRDVLDQG